MPFLWVPRRSPGDTRTSCWPRYEYLDFPMCRRHRVSTRIDPAIIYQINILGERTLKVRLERNHKCDTNTESIKGQI